MNKEVRNSFRERIESMFEFESCPNCNGKNLMLERQTYEFVKFKTTKSGIRIVGSNLDLDTLMEKISCLECGWKKEFD